MFHDLPESVTRDIISPVKQATRELPAIVKKIEDEIVQRELVPLMESSYVDEILYFTSDEFDNRICDSNFQNVKEVSFEDVICLYISNALKPPKEKNPLVKSKKMVPKLLLPDLPDFMFNINPVISRQDLDFLTNTSIA